MKLSTHKIPLTKKIYKKSQMSQFKDEAAYLIFIIKYFS